MEYLSQKVYREILSLYKKHGEKLSRREEAKIKNFLKSLLDRHNTDTTGQ